MKKEARKVSKLSTDKKSKKKYINCIEAKNDLNSKGQ